jgi:hypothetical protein
MPIALHSPNSGRQSASLCRWQPPVAQQGGLRLGGVAPSIGDRPTGQLRQREHILFQFLNERWLNLGSALPVSLGFLYPILFDHG